MIIKKNSGDIIFIISDDDKLRKMKNTFFNKDFLTDVIAFNLEEDGDPIEGEIYISFKKIKRRIRILDCGNFTKFTKFICQGT